MGGGNEREEEQQEKMEEGVATLDNLENTSFSSDFLGPAPIQAPMTMTLGAGNEPLGKSRGCFILNGQPRSGAHPGTNGFEQTVANETP